MRLINLCETTYYFMKIAKQWSCTIKVDTLILKDRLESDEVKESKMKQQRSYDKEYKIQALKLVEEIGTNKAAKELDVPVNTIYGWQRAQRDGKLDTGTQSPQTAISLAEEVKELRKQIKELTRENRRLKEENEFLEEASAFFAASRRKSAKTAG